MSRIRLFLSLVLLLSTGLAAHAAPKKLTPEDFKPTVKAPGYRTLQGLARTFGVKDALAHGKGAPLGGARFFAVLSSRKQQKVFAALVDGTGGKWKVQHHLVLDLTFSGEAKDGGRCDEDKVAAVGFVGDLDADGKREAKVRTLFCRVVPAIGPVKVRRLAMINLDGTPRVSLHTELGYDALPTAMGAIKARERYKDLNGDGHPDLSITQRETTGPGKDDKLKWKRSWRRIIYVPETDSYKERKVKKGKKKGKRKRVKR